MEKVDDFNGILTYTGVHVRPYDIDPLTINMMDIAHALSLNNRFNGHTKHPISVAQHSISVFNYVDHHGGSHMEKVQALMHDSPEAYIPDLSSPIKKRMTQFQELEEIVWKGICTRFDIDPVLSDLVHEADLQAFRHEHHTGMNKPVEPTLLIPHPNPPFLVGYASPTNSPTRWRHLFQERARSLDIHPVGD